MRQTYLREVVVFSGLPKFELLFLFSSQALDHAVKYMIIPLIVGLKYQIERFGILHFFPSWLTSIKHRLTDYILDSLLSKIRNCFAIFHIHHSLFTILSHSLTWLTMRDFSSRYCSILAPSITPELVKWLSIYFPNRLELSFRMVLALPKAEILNSKSHGMSTLSAGLKSEHDRMTEKTDRKLTDLRESG